MEQINFTNTDKYIINNSNSNIFTNTKNIKNDTIKSNIELSNENNENKSNNKEEQLIQNIKEDIKDIIVDKKGIRFQIDKDTNIVYSSIIDNETKKEIRKIPSELFLKLAKDFIERYNEKDSILFEKKV